MATILFSAAGAALGAGFGGTVLGLSGAVIGRAVGATIGRVVDQRLMGTGSGTVEVGKLDRLQVMGASEGTPIPKVWGRIRIPGQVIWASPFKENRVQSSGKGMPSQRVTQYSYTVSLAVALCEGEILGIGRIWADGDELKQKLLNMRVYHGSQQQLPDPVIEAVEGPDNAPAYRGIAYVIIEDMDLSYFGNRIPQLSFEVMRRGQGAAAETITDLQDAIRGVALIPGTGEYALATRKVQIENAFTFFRSVNVNAPGGDPDLVKSLRQLDCELPNCKAVSLVVSWFGSDLRCGLCNVQPKVESNTLADYLKPWRSGGIDRGAAQEIPKLDGRPIYGGTPSDASVIDAITALKNMGKDVMFYPFVLMDQQSGNQLVNPYSPDQIGQSALPWRGRITLSIAPGLPGTPDCTNLAEQEVAEFFGSASASDFEVVGEQIFYHGAPVWGYRRFILHYALLCKIAGGVEAFCIGSELRGLTQIRGGDHVFPTVQALLSLAEDVRAILGSEVKISYAADWSEYFGYHVGDNVYFHLDPLWSSGNIDFVGIDNYMPISDWRDSYSHEDIAWGSIKNKEYLKANIMGGEGFDWYYDSQDARDFQHRTPIQDNLAQEHWIFRPKDLKSWWSHLHYNRIGGVRSDTPTEWVPGSKPIRFTEYGCPSIDKGANQPNIFLDIRSSESGLPYFSTGARDDAIQMQYFCAQYEFWSEVGNNPGALSYDGKMIDLDHCYAWAWDARPFPEFPRDIDTWIDGRNYYTGHWLNGKVTSVPIARAIHDICSSSGVTAVKSGSAYGVVHGFASTSGESPRAMLQSLCLASDIFCFERRGDVIFSSDGIIDVTELAIDAFVGGVDENPSVEKSRDALAEQIGRVRLSYYEAEGDYSISVAEAVEQHLQSQSVSDVEYSIVLPRSTSNYLASKWLDRANSAQESLSFKLPLSKIFVDSASFFTLGGDRYRVDECSIGETITVRAARDLLAGSVTDRFDYDQPRWKAYQDAGRISRAWLDLPLLDKSQDASSPFIAVMCEPWSEAVALWDSAGDADYQINKVIEASSKIGRTRTFLGSSECGIIDRSEDLLIEMPNLVIESVSDLAFFDNRNLIAIGDGTSSNWELVSFKSVDLVGPGVFAIKSMLRGLFGTEALAAQGWPVGSVVVWIDKTVIQPELASDRRGLSRNYRIGHVSENLSSDEVIHDVIAFAGVGLRPYSVVHLRKLEGDDDAHRITWARRTRVDGDSWEGFDVPLAEDRELYSVQVRRQDDMLVRDVLVDHQEFNYSYHDRSLDGALDGYTVTVSQISQQFGRGVPRTIAVP